MGLIPCISCQRHVRAEEQGCPFCGATLAARGGGLTAAAITAGAALALAGCGSKAPPAAEPPGNEIGETAPDAGAGDVEPTPDPEPPDRGGEMQPLYGVDMME